MASARARSVRLGDKTFETPCFVLPASRGTIPHITPDHAAQLPIDMVLIGVEDFLEKMPDYAIDKTDMGIDKFLALPKRTASILAPRRWAPKQVKYAATSTDEAIAIHTADGYHMFASQEYFRIAAVLRPSGVVTPCDLPQEPIGRKRSLKVPQRSAEWANQGITDLEHTDASLYVGVPRVEGPLLQQFYKGIVDPSRVAGLTFYGPTDPSSIEPAFREATRLVNTPLATPHDVLDMVSNGFDMFTVDFVLGATENGLALSFALGTEDNDEMAGSAIAIDLWNQDLYTRDLSLLTPDSKLYQCTKAYVHHLLRARELEAYVVLQCHNIGVIAKFFQDIRKAIASGTFDTQASLFKTRYARELDLVTRTRARKGH